MNPSEIQAMMLKIFQETDLNIVHLPEEDIDIPILEEPLMAVAAADDPLFAELKKPEAISPDWMAPQEWLPEAKSVIVFFFPYSEGVRGRAAASDEPINEAWQYGYPAGSQVSKDLTAVLQKELEAVGIVVSNPIADPRFVSKRVPVKTAGEDDLHFTPTWSTRHAGYIAGLGTFGIHRHMITEKGCCGALTTLILDTFVEKYNFEGITVIPFCTSGSSGIGRSGSNMEALAGTGTWLEGKRFDGDVTEEELQSWIEGLK